MSHHEIHRSHRIGWLRAAVLGANDGIISTASLMIGVAAANASISNILVAGTAGVVAGAMSMAAGEYVSVSTQSDTENADLELEKKSLANDFEFETQELAEIYQSRGLDAPLARKVAEQLMQHDALGAHAREEIGIQEIIRAKPIQAAFFSAASFSLGATLPLLTAWATPAKYLMPVIALSSLILLMLLGGLAAKVGGASVKVGALRVGFWGLLAMGLTALVGQFFGG
jgi:VIT1/CCC1 family predicted Fe2+/Mn2+ transporter